MENIITARNLTKKYGNFFALKGVDFDIPVGRIVGVIGANGAGKTTMLNAILGLTSYEGDLSVFGKNPSQDRATLMNDVCFISDVATLPKYMKVREVLDYVEQIHDGFNRDVALNYLAKTTVPLDKKVQALSKGMTTQVHLALVMAIDAKLLVLDEPTLGLDIIFRKNFYSALLEDFFDEGRTIVITTHQVEEVEHILSDVIFVKNGEIVLSSDMDSLGEQFVELLVTPGSEEEADALRPISKGSAFGKTTNIYRDIDRETLKALGETRRLGLADVFVATVEGGA